MLTTMKRLTAITSEYVIVDHCSAVHSVDDPGYAPLD